MKTQRYYIRCLGADYRQILRDTQYQTAQALNYCMTQWYIWQVDRQQIKDETGKFPTAKELPLPVNRLYVELRARYPLMGSYMVSTIIQRAKKRWQADTKDVFYRLSKSLPTYRKTHPVLIGKQAYSLERTDQGYICTATIQSSNAPKDQRRISFLLNLKKMKPAQKAILDRLDSGEYRRGEATIGFNERKKKWYLNIAYEPPAPKHNLDQNRIIGIDLGINSAFYCALSDSPKRLSADGCEIERFRARIRQRRIAFQRQGKYSGRQGRGRVTILEPVRKLREKEKRYRDTRYHQYTRQIINFALANNAGTIQIEDLTSLKAAKSGKYILKDWAVADFQQKLKYKAAEHGIEVIEIAPQYTSQRCAACGHIDPASRQGKRFICTACGTREDADYNAAKNLAVKDIADKISANLGQT